MALPSGKPANKDNDSGAYILVLRQLLSQDWQTEYIKTGAQSQVHMETSPDIYIRLSVSLEN